MMEQQQHPLEGIMKTTMESIKEMVDVNTIVGDSVVMADGSVIIPVSRIGFGFVSGGGDYDTGGAAPRRTESSEQKIPFAGGSGAGISVVPVGFLVAGNGRIQLLPVQTNNPLERLIDMIPDVLCTVKNMWEQTRGDDEEIQ